MKTPCTICHRKEKTKHFSLYVVGSEGLNVCHPCEMGIISYVQEMMRIAGESRMQGWKDGKEIKKR